MRRAAKKISHLSHLVISERHRLVSVLNRYSHSVRNYIDLIDINIMPVFLRKTIEHWAQLHTR